MIKYALRCSNDHHFESWFKDSSTFELLRDEGHVTCPMCGEWQVDRALMTPHVANNAGRSRGLEDANQPSLPLAQSTGPEPALIEGEEIRVDTVPQAPRKGEPMPSQEEITAAFQFFAKLKKHVQNTHEDVGDNFADEARAIHFGDARVRGIYGSANADQVEELVDEGIVVMPLPNVRHDA